MEPFVPNDVWWSLCVKSDYKVCLMCVYFPSDMKRIRGSIQKHTPQDASSYHRTIWEGHDVAESVLSAMFEMIIIGTWAQWWRKSRRYRDDSLILKERFRETGGLGIELRQNTMNKTCSISRLRCVCMHVCVRVHVCTHVCVWVYKKT